MFLIYLRTRRPHYSANGLLEQKNRKQTTQPAQICVQVVLFQAEKLRVISLLAILPPRRWAISRRAPR